MSGALTRIKWRFLMLLRSTAARVLLCVGVIFVVVSFNLPTQPVRKVPYDLGGFDSGGDNLESVAFHVPSWLNDSETPVGIAGDWLQVEGSQRNAFLYSAYQDNRMSTVVIRIVAILKRRYKASKCRVWTEDGQTAVLNAKVHVIREGWSLPYSAYFILCSSPPDKARYVTLDLDGTQGLSSAVPVQHLALQKPLGKLSVCVKPFHYDFNRAVWVVEFIETYMALGADSFIFYNHTVGPDLERVLRHYQKLGLVHLLPWALPVQTQKEIRTEGLFAALNDCNLRSVGRFPLAAYVDVDEFIFPSKKQSLQELIQNLGHYNAYIFQNVFHYLYWENDTAVYDTLFTGDLPLGIRLFEDETLVPYLLTAFKTRRLQTPHRHGQRSKYITRPEQSVEVGNHLVWSFVGESLFRWFTWGGKKTLNVATNEALSHHYRICEFGGFDCLTKPSRIDRTAHQWLPEIATGVAMSCRKIFPETGHCPVAPPLGSPW